MHSFCKKNGLINGLITSMKKIIYDEKIVLNTFSLVAAKFLIELSK